MKTKTSKFNILLIAIIALLIFVAGAKYIGSTHSWLSDKSDVGFVLNVDNINMIVKQGDRQIDNGGKIYLGTDTIEINKSYDINATVTNDEAGEGYYVRFKAIAVINGTEYNINEYITTEFYKNANGWAYNTANKNNSTPIKMTQSQTKTFITSINITKTGTFANFDMQGKHFALYIYLEGSPVADFSL